jgi:lipopolysaccharide export LptBFGC system permease protein LptF
VVPGTVRLRDISFIVIAVETLIGMVLLLIIAVLLAVIIVVIYDRVIPILEQMNRAIGNAADTVQTVRGTTAFIGEKMVNPVIKVSSYASGVRRILKGILDLWPRRK